MGEPLECEPLAAHVRQSRPGTDGVWKQFDRAHEFITETRGLVIGAKIESILMRCDCPPTRTHDAGSAISPECEFACPKRDAALASPRQGPAVEGAMAKRLGQSLAVEGGGRWFRPFRARQQRTGELIVHLPDIAAPTKSRTEPGCVRQRIEHIDPQGGVGEMEHGRYE